MASPVLAQITDEKKIPPPETACQDCSHATWMEFKAGVKCYCAITMAWMYEPSHQESKIVWACDKQMSMEEAMEPMPAMPTIRQAESQTAVVTEEIIQTQEAPVSLFADMDIKSPAEPAGPNSFMNFNHPA